jgi:hypothetical protein
MKVTGVRAGTAHGHDERTMAHQSLNPRTLLGATPALPADRAPIQTAGSRLQRHHHRTAAHAKIKCADLAAKRATRRHRRSSALAELRAQQACGVDAALP